MQTTSVLLADKIASYDFSPILAHTIKENPGIVKFASVAVDEYKMFIKLIAIVGGDLAVPSKLVDKIWHSHILHTKEYAEFCRNVVGRFVHHQPHDAHATDEEKQFARQNLINASIKVFGKNVFTLTESDCSGNCDACKGNCNVDV